MAKELFHLRRRAAGVNLKKPLVTKTGRKKINQTCPNLPLPRYYPSEG
jgi:hypothetical protein